MKQKNFTPTLFSLSFVFFIWVAPLQAKIIYVDHDATGSGDGTSWTNAFVNLQAAIDFAGQGDTLFVAEGMYYPTSKFSGDTDRHFTFYINKDVALYGGFQGLPGTEGNLAAQDRFAFPTTLSGNLGDLGDTLDNAFHVVYIDHVSDTMRLDGFFISEGNNAEGSGFDATGAGIFNHAESGRSNPVIANCYISNNHAVESGGGMMHYASLGGRANPLILNCRIEANTGSGGGGITFLTDTEGQCNATIINTYLQGNTARTAQGSAISTIAHSATTAIRMINCIVTGNHGQTANAFEAFVTGTGIAQPEFINCVFAGNKNGSVRVADLGLRTSTLKVRNSIFANNGFSHGLSVNGATEDVAYSMMQFGSFAGEGNVFLDPQFVDAPLPENTPHMQGDVHLQNTSPGIDAGNNNEVPSGIATDIAGLPRFVDVTTGETGGLVDMGAFEFQEAITSTKAAFQKMEWDVFPNPASSNIMIALPQSDNNYLCSMWSGDGKQIAMKEISAGLTSVQFNVDDLPGGLYYVMLVTGGRSDFRKLIIE